MCDIAAHLATALLDRLALCLRLQVSGLSTAGVRSPGHVQNIDVAWRCEVPAVQNCYTGITTMSKTGMHIYFNSMLDCMSPSLSPTCNLSMRSIGEVKILNIKVGSSSSILQAL